jgi:hypothetical protein
MHDERTPFQLVCDLCGKIIGESQIADQRVTNQSLNESADNILYLLQRATGKSYGLDLIKWTEWLMPLHKDEREKMVLQFIKVKGRILKIENS